MECFKNQGCENEGFEDGGFLNWVPDKDPRLQLAGAGYSGISAALRGSTLRYEKLGDFGCLARTRLVSLLGRRLVRESCR
jgi:hypothetical protein